ncbi:hypothetical protein L1994_02725 [Methanomicrobium antiquum]|uniref:Uncharacterized protein n=1 Tax=Methanomicrobium antiquum TaxID=487686 RepID=A0AAF0JU64_9EURY|nr:hypothetical protein [Methanomicrobium antiquum]WFN37318.1 hypothetical protein L1994_02725 [Methanomicrobium antiquum]
MESATWNCDFSSYSGNATYSVVAEAINTVGSCSLTWSWKIESSSHCVPTGEYIDFGFAKYRSDCDSEESKWRKAMCHQNALARWGYASISRNIPTNSYDDIVESSDKLGYFKYQRDDEVCEGWENCFLVSNNHFRHLYVVELGVTNHGDHAILAEFIGEFSNFDTEKTNFDNWNFFQYEDLDIRPGDGQMPYYPSNDPGNPNKVIIQKITEIYCSRTIKDNGEYYYTPLYYYPTFRRYFFNNSIFHTLPPITAISFSIHHSDL